MHLVVLVHSAALAGGEIDELLKTAADQFQADETRAKAISALCETKPSRGELEDRIVDSLGSALADADDGERRQEVFERIKASGSAGVSDAFCKAVAALGKATGVGGDVAFFIQLIEEAGKRAGSDDIPTFMALFDHQRADVRASAAQAIHRIGGVPSLKALSDFLRGSMEKRDFQTAEKALVAINESLSNQYDELKGEPEFGWVKAKLRSLVGPLLGMAGEKLRPHVAQLAASVCTMDSLRLLLQSGQAEAAEAVLVREARAIPEKRLLEMLMGLSAVQRGLAAKTLAIRNREAPQEDTDALLVKISSRYRVSVVLPELSDLLHALPCGAAPEAVRAELAKKVVNGLDHSALGVHAAIALRALGVPKGFEASVREALKGEVRNVLRKLTKEAEKERRPAFHQAAKLRDRELLAPLLAALSAQEPETREAAARALGTYAFPEAEQALMGALEERYIPVRREVVLALGRLRSRTAVDKLFPLLCGEHWEIQTAAGRALAWLPADEALPRLTRLLKQANWWQDRAAVLLALGRTHSETAVPLLAAAVGDRSLTNYALRALSLNGTEAAEKALIATLASEDWNAQIHAARLLGVARLAGATDQLRELTRSSDPVVAEAARRALADLQVWE